MESPELLDLMKIAQAHDSSEENALPQRTQMASLERVQGALSTGIVRSNFRWRFAQKIRGHPNNAYD